MWKKCGCISLVCVGLLIVVIAVVAITQDDPDPAVNNETTAAPVEEASPDTTVAHTANAETTDAATEEISPYPGGQASMYRILLASEPLEDTPLFDLFPQAEGRAHAEGDEAFNPAIVIHDQNTLTALAEADERGAPWTFDEPFWPDTELSALTPENCLRRASWNDIFGNMEDHYRRYRRFEAVRVVQAMVGYEVEPLRQEGGETAYLMAVTPPDDSSPVWRDYLFVHPSVHTGMSQEDAALGFRKGDILDACVMVSGVVRYQTHSSEVWNVPYVIPAFLHRAETADLAQVPEELAKPAVETPALDMDYMHQALARVSISAHCQEVRRFYEEVEIQAAAHQAFLPALVEHDGLIACYLHEAVDEAAGTSEPRWPETGLNEVSADTCTERVSYTDIFHSIARHQGRYRRMTVRVVQLIPDIGSQLKGASFHYAHLVAMTPPENPGGEWRNYLMMQPAMESSGTGALPVDFILQSGDSHRKHVELGSVYDVCVMIYGVVHYLTEEGTFGWVPYIVPSFAERVE